MRPIEILHSRNLKRLQNHFGNNLIITGGIQDESAIVVFTLHGNSNSELIVSYHEDGHDSAYGEIKSATGVFDKRIKAKMIPGLELRPPSTKQTTSEKQ